MIAFIRRWKYTTALVTVCVAVGAWTIFTSHVYSGPLSWWRLASAGAAGVASNALYRWEARRNR